MGVSVYHMGPQWAPYIVAVYASLAGHKHWQDTSTSAACDATKAHGLMGEFHNSSGFQTTTDTVQNKRTGVDAFANIHLVVKYVCTKALAPHHHSKRCQQK